MSTAAVLALVTALCVVSLIVNAALVLVWRGFLSLIREKRDEEGPEAAIRWTLEKVLGSAIADRPEAAQIFDGLAFVIRVDRVASAPGREALFGLRVVRGGVRAHDAQETDVVGEEYLVNRQPPESP